MTKELNDYSSQEALLRNNIADYNMKKRAFEIEKQSFSNKGQSLRNLQKAIIKDVGNMAQNRKDLSKLKVS
jgi:hypothetical protein